MRFIILAYHPGFVNPEKLRETSTSMYSRLGIEVILVEHFSHEAEPIYCVQFVDSKKDAQG